MTKAKVKIEKVGIPEIICEWCLNPSTHIMRRNKITLCETCFDQEEYKSNQEYEAIQAKGERAVMEAYERNRKLN